MKRILCLALTLALASIAQASLFGPRGDSNAEKKANIRTQRDEMLAQLYAANPEMKKILKQSAVSFREGTVTAGSSTDMRAGTQKSDTTGAGLATRGGMEIYQFTQSGVALQKKYHQQISAAVSPVRAAQFLQVENQMAIFVDLNLASEMPLVGASPANK